MNGPDLTAPRCGADPDSSGREMALSATPAAGAAASTSGVSGRSSARETSLTYGRLEATFLFPLGLALAGGVGLMAAVGLALAARWPAVTADEGTALSTAKAALRGDHQWIEMLAPPVQVALYAPFVGLGHPELATAVPALFGAALLTLVVAIAWRITGMPWAGAIAGLFLLSSPEYWARSSNLPAYQPFVFFGYLGLLLTAASIHSPRRSGALAIAGGVALAMSAYSFTIGLLFLPAALLLALAWRGCWRPVLLSLSSAGVLLLPFAIWHVTVAGVRHAFYYPYNFVLVEYWDDFSGFWSRPEYDLPGYVAVGLPNMLLGAAPIWLWLLGAVGLIVIGRTHGIRLSAVIAIAMVMALLPHVVVEVLYARYAYPLVPGLALVAGIGLSLAVQSLARRQTRRRLSVLAAVTLAGLGVVGASATISIHLDQVRTARASPQYAAMQSLASNVDDRRALLARDSHLQALLPNNQVYSHLFFSEGEYLDYILWQDEERVRRLMEGRNIGWVVFRNNVDRWERDANLWTITATGYPPRHHICLPQSAGFTQVYDGQFFTLYRVREDWLSSDSVSGSCPATAVEKWSLPGAWRHGPATPP